MKAYRILSKEEYKSLVETKSLLKKRRAGAWTQPERFVHMEREKDQTGKFFFFCLEDAVFFGRDLLVSFFGGYRENDVILEIDIDKKQGFDNLVAGEYDFNDKSTPEKREHIFPELYLPSELIDEKLQKGEYRLIDSEYRKGIESAPMESEREPHYLLLGDAIWSVMKSRRELKSLMGAKERIMAASDNMDEEAKEKLKADIGYIDVDIEEVKGEIAAKLEKLKEIYNDFANEHEKYMMLAPRSEK